MTQKTVHEFRDPIHGFIHVDTDERRVIDSPPVQRLRHIHQLATTYLVYPGATHRRFEHSLGVMELAGRVFDIVTAPDNLHPSVRELFPEIKRDDSRLYWRRVVRMGALCHDLGHLPFSHAAEHELLPDGWDHERLSVGLIMSQKMQALWHRMTPPLRPEDIVKVAVGAKKLSGQTFTDWEAIASEIIVGDAFGVDRMDYLLRDSLHAGVAYGRFDHFRLVETLRILPPPTQVSSEPQLGVEEGGLHSAEALVLARYFMFSQVYYHPVRRAYDVHLRDFLQEWLPIGKFSTEIDDHLKMTDTEVLAAMAQAAKDESAPGHDPARRIMQRQHFRELWRRNPADSKLLPDPGRSIYDAARQEFGDEVLRRDRLTPDAPYIEFPVWYRDEDRVLSAQELSEVLPTLPAAGFDYVLIRPDLVDQAGKWLRENRQAILERATREIGKEEESSG